MDDDFCILCGETIGMWDKVCKHCGTHQFGDNDEYYPTENSMREARKIMTGQSNKRKGKRTGLFDEEILAYGLYPDDEGYKMSLISRILGRKGKI